MGEVYRAKDTKLDREVAIKVLPAALADDPDRLARFEREAKVLAALNHPNIAHIYGVEERALVMELVAGTTVHGPLPLDEALGVAAQIASALEAAHEKNIIHRDLKPANIMITSAGIVKVLDFGLAAIAQPSDTSNPEHSPTLTISPTRSGMILGTAAYMSPEQARGKTVDKRADIWAFGVVLFEILTGKRLFEGETVSDTLAQVLTKEPDWEQVPAKLRRLLRKCLEKDPNKRLRDMGDAWELLEDAPPPIASSRSRLSWVVAALLALTTVAASLIAYRATRPAELKPLVRLDVDLGSELPPSTIGGSEVIISPDGTRLVYVSQGKLFTRRLDQPNAVELAGTDGAVQPFFSPDGQWVAFFAQRALKKIPADGGAAIVLCNSGNPRGGSWGEDGSIFATLTFPGVVSRIPSIGGTPTPVTDLAKNESVHNWPQILPGGRAVLFTAKPRTGTYENATIEVMSLQDRRRKTLIQGGSYGRYVGSSAGHGYLIYYNRGSLFAAPFDLDALETHGPPVPVLEGIQYNDQTGFAHLDFSRTGTLLYRRAGSGLVTAQWLDSEGKTQALLAKPGNYAGPHLSPDGQRLAVEMAAGSNRDIWVYEWHRDTLTRLTFDAGGGTVMNPVWSPDGRYIAFAGKGGIFWTRSDGAGKSEPLTQSKNVQTPWSFTPDGKRLAFDELDPTVGSALWTLPLESDGTGLRGGKPELFLESSFNESMPMFSPDGRWLAYNSYEPETYQVYVRPFPDRGGKWQISNGGGSDPVWSRNGRELFFRTADNRIMVATYTVKGDSFVADQPRGWSEKRLGGRDYDVAPDGKRIAALMPVVTTESQQAQSHVVFLLNFTDELRRKVPLNSK